MGSSCVTPCEYEVDALEHLLEAGDFGGQMLAAGGCDSINAHLAVCRRPTARCAFIESQPPAASIWPPKSPASSKCSRASTSYSQGVTHDEPIHVVPAIAVGSENSIRAFQRSEFAISTGPGIPTRGRLRP